MVVGFTRNLEIDQLPLWAWTMTPASDLAMRRFYDGDAATRRKRRSSARISDVSQDRNTDRVERHHPESGYMGLIAGLYRAPGAPCRIGCKAPAGDRKPVERHRHLANGDGDGDGDELTTKK
ncbi:MAG: hypothetical protein EOP61_24255 [Sphingomonadales bacterium]|nr:MAG: hypothetical protein EOP61_24255 [Sphingomonadales bacterium]